MPDLNYVIVARDQLGTPANVPLTGLSPQWVFLSRIADGVAVPRPPIVEIGYGQYRLAYDPEVSGEASGQIDLGPLVIDPLSRYIDVVFYLNDARTCFNLDAPTSSRSLAPYVTFLGADTVTSGSWKGVYGTEGSWVASDPSTGSPTLPSGTTVSVTGGTAFVWSASSTETRALQKADGSGRIASCWYSGTTLTLAINQTGDRARKVSLYSMDFEAASRMMKVEVIDGSGSVVDTRTLSGFRNGTYLTWSLKGQVSIRVTNLQAGTNAVVGGLFFG